MIMEKIGILLVSYGAREVAMADAFLRSQQYQPELYIVDKQKNPFNIEIAEKHAVIPDLNIKGICDFVKKNMNKISFGIVGSEKPIIEGVRDLVEKETKVPLICPTKECAIEGSKVAQRKLFEKIVPEVNPRYKVFDPTNYKDNGGLQGDFKVWIDELGGVEKSVIKPDRPGFGKGVGVGGEHFTTFEQAYEHFLSICGKENAELVIVEEKIEGEESSYQGICDGKHLVNLPETRDYKRAFDDDEGANTGGMGSYKATGDILPFMTEKDRSSEIKIERKIFRKLIKEFGDGLRGFSCYDAYIHTGNDQKILERNSRPGDPEIINLLPIIEDDFVEVCLKIIDGSLTNIEIDKRATVVTYIVPDVYPAKDDRVRKIDLKDAYELQNRLKDKIRIYPASVELKNDETFALSSRTAAVVGIADDINSARDISLEGVRAIEGTNLRNRGDIASDKHIAKSIRHIEELRSAS
jgi:phosphoribosylamine--glycine ligase